MSTRTQAHLRPARPAMYDFTWTMPYEGTFSFAVLRRAVGAAIEDGVPDDAFFSVGPAYVAMAWTREAT